MGKCRLATCAPLASVLILSLPAGAQVAAAAPDVCDSGLQSRSTRFVVKGAVVKDKKTGLIWQRCSVGQTWSPSKGCKGEAKEFEWKDLDQAAGKGWRVPTQGELVAIQEVSCAHCDVLERAQNLCTAAIDKGVFPNTPASMYWSTTVYPDKNPGMGFFGEGGGGGSAPADLGMYVRLVRDK